RTSHSGSGSSATVVFAMSSVEKWIRNPMARPPVCYRSVDEGSPRGDPFVRLLHVFGVWRFIAEGLLLVRNLQSRLEGLGRGEEVGGPANAWPATHAVHRSRHRDGRHHLAGTVADGGRHAGDAGFAFGDALG